MSFPSLGLFFGSLVFTLFAYFSLSLNNQDQGDHFTKMNHKVFVYGTLKRNEPNHHWLANRENGYGKYVADGVTKTKYPLIIATRYNIPFLLYSPGDGHNVRGEIYQVDDDMLSKLDILEDHPSYYVRELDDITVVGKGEVPEVKEMKCWVYFLKKFKQDLMTRPLLEVYSSRGGHGLPYMERLSKKTNSDEFMSIVR
ncbi:putative gamma-glutamylcyclotransferase CG2811 isoform X2 [Ostrinia furnacalis]|uniref:putative gamma-glutamylcyclotransferase CG2811 isoform X2 n=1 Tax=Ostrinia furnacalis TaxID=93504 RepID=UPI00103E40BB|nr:putative gamma-glutamylcyclotransferase CG2811 isoform X2 [Ostrinia furnacalis]